MGQPGEPGRLGDAEWHLPEPPIVEYSHGVEWWADCYPQWKKAGAQPSSQGPCICPEDGVAWACPRHAYMQDYVGQNPFKDHLRELREVTAQLARDTGIPPQLLDGVTSAEAFHEWQVASGLTGYPDTHDQTDRQVIKGQEEDLGQEG